MVVTPAEDAETLSLASGVLSWCVADSCREKFVVNSPFISPSSPARSRGRIRLFSGILTAPLSVELLQIEEGGR
jgi:hypothetical protein